MKKYFTQLSLLALALLLVPLNLSAQRRNKTQKAVPSIPSELYSSMEYRLVGPFRGGRSAAVTGVPNEPNLFYMGSTGGGVWKTLNGGRTWENISDGYFGGSLSLIHISEPTRPY